MRDDGGRGSSWLERSFVARWLRFSAGVVAIATIFANMLIVAGLPGGLDVPNYFSFFTNECNLFGGVVLIISGLIPRERLPRWWDSVRGAATVYLVMTAIVFAVLLENDPRSGIITPWTNFIAHKLVPLLILADWVVLGEAKHARWWRPLIWLSYPIGYLAYTLIRGGIIGWYPYPFLDPRGPSGYEGLIPSAGGVVAGFLVGAILIHLLGLARRQLGRRIDLARPLPAEVLTTR